MREITCGEIAAVVERLLVRAATMLPPDVAMQIECAWDTEASAEGRAVLESLMDNLRYAGAWQIPVRPDTGMAQVFVDVGQEVHITGGPLNDAVQEGIRRGHLGGFLPDRVAADPLAGGETDAPAVVHTRLVAGDRVDILVALREPGGESRSALHVFPPGAGREEIEAFIVGAVGDAEIGPMAPIVLGVGLGGTVDRCALLAARALLRPLDRRSPAHGDMERRLLRRINGLGIGPRGLGGTTTALAVNIEAAPAHADALPCVVSPGSHALLRARWTI